MVVLSGVAGSLSAGGAGGRTPRVSEDKRTRTNARAAHTRQRAGQRVGGALGDVGGGPCSRAEGGGPATRPPPPPVAIASPANVGLRCGNGNPKKSGTRKKAEKPTVRGKSARKAAFRITSQFVILSLLCQYTQPYFVVHERYYFR
eukprot:COSAG06_NODE_3432_length_5355_cov_9.890982_2_plen_146_part_00